jgi:subtilisin family serine protease
MPEVKTLVRVPVDRERRAAARMTGRYLMTFRPDAHSDISDKMTTLGIGAASAPPPDKAARPLPLGNRILLPRIGVTVVDPTPEQEEGLHTMAAQEAAVVGLEPERINSAIDDISAYVRGWRDATDALAAKIIDTTVTRAADVTVKDGLSTWGLVATLVIKCRFSGQNIKLGVLDTGFDLTHQDFVGRNITSKSFVGDNQPFHDGVGHGTHCVGTAAGPLHSALGTRYGIAYNAQIFVGRVLDDTGRGGDLNILQGIEWALENNCDIVSLSLGAPWVPGDPPYSPAYEQAAQRALSQGCLLVVAAGNDASNPQYVGAVGTPGNSPSVLTVAAIDQTFATAPFSDRATPAAPGVKSPDLAGPGVSVYSAWPVAKGAYNTISGTSMATPHVAGIAALFAEANSTLRGRELKNAVVGGCMSLADQTVRQGEIGSGLVQAYTQ